MEYDFHKVEIESRVGWVELNRPPVNATSWDMLHEHLAVFERVTADPAVRVVVVASALERYFSAGADLEVFRGIGADGMREWLGVCHRIVRVLRGSEKPLLAAIP
ncbi:MAG: hypothetical protein GWO02_17675, partial [Gammaproteobacteria bacterium]|nr:hypothetical protein [Gammaproteobacteria bacterium]